MVTTPYTQPEPASTNMPIDLTSVYEKLGKCNPYNVEEIFDAFLDSSDANSTLEFMAQLGVIKTEPGTLMRHMVDVVSIVANRRLIRAGDPGAACKNLDRCLKETIDKYVAAVDVILEGRT